MGEVGRAGWRGGIRLFGEGHHNRGLGGGEEQPAAAVRLGFVRGEPYGDHWAELCL